MNFEQWVYHPSKMPDNHSEKEKQLLVLEDQFFEELKGRADVQQWLEQHHSSSPDSYDNFLRQHARHKRHLVSIAGHYLRQMEKLPEMRYPDECRACIEAIQQKKLFNLQVQWRAGLVELPGVELSIDFQKMKDEVLNCSFLEPVSAGDIGLMKAFLATDEGAEWIRWGGSESWQSYDNFFDHSEEESFDDEDYPRWYAFYDDHRGTGALLQLPDQRGRKEAFYQELGRALQQERAEAKRKEAPQEAAAPPPKPFLSYWDEQKAEFYRRFEDPYVLALFEFEHAERKSEEERNDGYEPSDDLHYLEDCPHPAPMPAAANWREALHLCMIRSVARSVSHELDLAFSEYCFYRETGIASPRKKEYDNEWLHRMIRDQILDGRESVGEPRDFNF